LVYKHEYVACSVSINNFVSQY